jgi:hypothetical protein
VQHIGKRSVAEKCPSWHPHTNFNNDAGAPHWAGLQGQASLPSRVRLGHCHRLNFQPQSGEAERPWPCDPTTSQAP